MSEPLLTFKGLYGDAQPSFVTDFIHIEPLAIRSKIYEWEIQEHVHTDLLQVFFIEAGNGILISEKKEIRITGPSVLIIPSNTLHGFTFNTDVIGQVLSISESYVYALFKEKPVLIKAIEHLEVLMFRDEDPVFNDLSYWNEKLQEELFTEHPAKQMAIQAYFQLILLNIARFKSANQKLDIYPQNKALDHFRQFQQLIRETAQQPLSIKQYATQLNITQTHLNRICHTVANLSALKVVQEYTVNEAKKYLLNTTYSIAEIAYFLNFNDPAYFGRLFKKRVGVSPGEFRKG